MRINDFFLDIVDIDIEREDEEEEPDLEGRIHVEKVDFITSTMPTTQVSTEPSIQMDDECHLPYYPAADPNLENAVWRFGTFAHL